MMWGMWKMCYGMVNQGGPNLIIIEKIETKKGKVCISNEHVVWKKNEYMRIIDGQVIMEKFDTCAFWNDTSRKSPR